MLCGTCGGVNPRSISSVRPAVEPWALALQIGEYRAALDAPVVPRRTIVLRGAIVVATIVSAIVIGLVGAFHARGAVNLRYIGALAALVTLVGAFAVAAVAWAAGDPMSPLRDVDRRRLEEAERMLRETEGGDGGDAVDGL